MIASGWADLAAGVEVGASPAAEAIGHLSSTGCRAFQARGWELRGRSLVSSNRPDAIQALNRAVAIFDACGAVWRRDRIRVVLKAGDVYDLEPGHVPIFEEDTEILEFSPTKEYQQTIDVFAKNMAAMRTARWRS